MRSMLLLASVFVITNTQDFGVGLCYDANLRGRHTLYEYFTRLPSIIVLQDTIYRTIFPGYCKIQSVNKVIKHILQMHISIQATKTSVKLVYLLALLYSIPHSWWKSTPEDGRYLFHNSKYYGLHFAVSLRQPLLFLPNVSRSITP